MIKYTSICFNKNILEVTYQDEKLLGQGLLIESSDFGLHSVGCVELRIDKLFLIGTDGGSTYRLYGHETSEFKRSIFNKLLTLREEAIRI